MNQAAADRAREAINRVGRTISIRRMKGTPQTVVSRADVKATVRNYTPEDLAPGITAGMRQIIVSKLDLIAAGFAIPVIKGDRILLGDAFEIPTTVDAVDQDHREYQGCYEIRATGS
ncbi:hypothetical protein ABIF65_003693 [Bradyrhizobium japonicum]|uniref:hypothetical protein n=1 Tax=Bradyrhizobium TaxID=374 RepID=UPI0004AF8A65|nr:MULTISPECIES: hypothetical protein [Bradyrhizobium]MBR1071207.1 hypothetical protein [Bradyrhizobium liaoningense]